jgi:hypothetical protein
MTLRTLALLFLWFAPYPAEAQYFNYLQWSALPPIPRAAYIAGVFDSLTGYSVNEVESKHYFTCLERAAIKNTQLADNVIQYASTHSALQKGSVQKALLQYLTAACGKPD